MKKTYVKLNRILGATTRRFDCPVLWEMIVPVKQANGTFKPPYNVDGYFAGFAFKKYLLEGETILVGSSGGWNYLLKSDVILESTQK